MIFLDTNVLLYSISTDPQDGDKRKVAQTQELLTEDLNHGQSVGSLVIRNPFRPD